MNTSRQTLVIAFALFSLFFGAGNLILPPFLGYQATGTWPWVLFGFALTAVVLPIMAIYGHARIQGTMLDFARKASPAVALFYSICVYIISIALPSPRTASVTYEMAVQPYMPISSLVTSTIYFVLVLVFVLNRTRILSLIGKFLTPLIIVILVAIILLGLVGPTADVTSSAFEHPLSAGMLEGYQTFDAIGGVLVGGVLIISLNLQGRFNFSEKRKMIGRAGLIAGAGLFLIYGGLIALGAHFSGEFQIDQRTELLTSLSTHTLGKLGTSFLSVLVALACFTTAVGIVTGTADFVKGLFKESRLAYVLTAVVGCVIGVAVGQFDVHYIIDVALPALMFIYPITIVFIILNVLPKKWASPLVFKWMVGVTFLCSIPDFLGFLVSEEQFPEVLKSLPLSEHHMGWLIPAAVTFLVVNLIAMGSGAKVDD